MKGQKKIPERMCLGCRTVHPKKDMIRVVRSPENVYSVDMTGKSPGRGAYICRNEECFRRAEKEHGFERASVRVIAKNAGVTPGAIYKHFKSKEDIFRAIVIPTLDHL